MEIKTTIPINIKVKQNAKVESTLTNISFKDFVNEALRKHVEESRKEREEKNNE